MKFSENWLRTWVNPALSSEALAHALTMAGLEVEGLEAVAPAFNNVVVAEVLEVVKHPNADRLNVCQVNVGEAQPLTIVCGAANVAVGVKVPCARIGAVLPGDFAIRQAKVRSIESFGMLCSEKELGLATESEGLWLLPKDAPVGKPLREYLELDDRLFTIKLTPNRSDCSGIAGLAREVAALTGSALQPVLIKKQPVTLAEQLPVKVEDAQGCPLYCGRLVCGVDAAIPTPAWMLRRLERSGLGGINVVLDITKAENVLVSSGVPYTVIRHAVIWDENTPATGYAWLSEDHNVFTGITRKDLATLTMSCLDNPKCMNKIYNAADNTLSWHRGLRP
jgi:phenylalanyl-tRNA synthetase beta chain